jgi:hypothetical protein
MTTFLSHAIGHIKNPVNYSMIQFSNFESPVNSLDRAMTQALPQSSLSSQACQLSPTIPDFVCHCNSEIQNPNGLSLPAPAHAFGE